MPRFDNQTWDALAFDFLLFFPTLNVFSPPRMLLLAAVLLLNTELELEVFKADIRRDGRAPATPSFRLLGPYSLIVLGC